MTCQEKFWLFEGSAMRDDSRCRTLYLYSLGARAAADNRSDSRTAIATEKAFGEGP